MENSFNKIWSVWIDGENKVISFKEIPNAKQVYFESREVGMEKITGLVSKGYKIG